MNCRQKKNGHNILMSEKKGVSKSTTVQGSAEMQVVYLRGKKISRDKKIYAKTQNVANMP